MNKTAHLLQLIDQLEASIMHFEIQNQTVSSASVSWHIDHSLKVINSVITTLEKSDATYRWDFNWKRTYFFLRKSIPRGKARAPKAVQSFETITPKDIERQLKTARFLVKELENMDRKKNFIHPFIGKLHWKQAITFMEIHTQHHLYIIHDIVEKN